LKIKGLSGPHYFLCMTYRIGTYLKFLFRSTNQHGVHSPFVYQYLTKCLYKSSGYKGSRVHRVLLKSIPYLHVKSLLVRSNTQEVEKLLYRAYPELDFEPDCADMIYVGSDQFLQINASWLHDHCHLQSMILLEDIHRSRETSKKWQSLCEKTWVTVSIDFYFGGIIFLRTEQVKQHFRIRI